jgi:hypothetical protein
MHFKVREAAIDGVERFAEATYIEGHEGRENGAAENRDAEADDPHLHGHATALISS